jgi:uncharacterized protein YbjQ (UPF0145 family)
MNWLEPTRSFAVAVLLALSGATALAQDTAVRIYDAGELTLDRYTVIKRIWAGTWRASFWVPNHSDPAGAIEALTAEAADAGADGVVNLHCLSDTAWDGRYFCYGLAIKLKEAASASWQPLRTDPPAQ